MVTVPARFQAFVLHTAFGCLLLFEKAQRRSAKRAEVLIRVTFPVATLRGPGIHHTDRRFAVFVIVASTQCLAINCDDLAVSDFVRFGHPNRSLHSSGTRAVSPIGVFARLFPC